VTSTSNGFIRRRGVRLSLLEFCFLKIFLKFNISEILNCNFNIPKIFLNVKYILIEIF